MLTAAARGPGETSASIAASLRATPNASSGTIAITVSALDAARPVAIANAVSDLYIADQRTETTKTLRAALDEAEGRRKLLEASYIALGPTQSSAGAERADDNVEGLVVPSARDVLGAQLIQTYESIEKFNSAIAANDPGVSVLFPAMGAARGKAFTGNPRPRRRGSRFGDRHRARRIA